MLSGQCFQLSKWNENMLLWRLSQRTCVPYWKSQEQWLCFLDAATGQKPVQQDWQDFGRPKDEPPDLGLVLDHSNLSWSLSFLIHLVCQWDVYLGWPTQETLWALSPQRGWVLSQWEASICAKKIKNSLLSSSLRASTETTHFYLELNNFCKEGVHLQGPTGGS